MHIKKLISDICTGKNLEMTDSDISSIVVSCKFADIPDEIDDSKIELVKKIADTAIASYTNMIMSDAKKEEINVDVDVCPLCNKKYVEAELLHGRKVKYCSTHRVAMPKKKDQ